MKDVYKVAGYIPVSVSVLMDDPFFAMTHPWYLPDPNPFPRFRLFRWLP